MADICSSSPILKKDRFHSVKHLIEELLKMVDITIYNEMSVFVQEVTLTHTRDNWQSYSELQIHILKEHSHKSFPNQPFKSPVFTVSKHWYSNLFQKSYWECYTIQMIAKCVHWDSHCAMKLKYFQQLIHSKQINKQERLAKIQVLFLMCGQDCFATGTLQWFSMKSHKEVFVLEQISGHKIEMNISSGWMCVLLEKFT